MTFAEKPCAQCAKPFKPISSMDNFCEPACILLFHSDDAEGDCRVWRGSKGNYGYGQVRYRKKLIRAHRMAWQLANGDIPEGMILLHSCDNPPCININHLRLGTQADNVKDMLDRGRAQIGERCSWSKLSNKDVLEIRDAVANGKRGIITKLSKLYGVSHQTISDIKLRKRRKIN